ncbi:hypothetical protein SVI_1184 [Shewanella violacea DSS12]|uniref:Uncharacterized protein n=1 Tax=Shewanella violacea (strain JCM 10179 / CIP 106290 / LMG 19151 / DSS12) TaxID=637905 RepID=D4ZHK6_SHEVD|nr:hypothetical protein SVI_1184 [Shewanella violacea DSS12]
MPPIILNAGVPRTKVSLANSCPQFGQVQGILVKSSTIRSLKHFTKEPLPPLRYLNSWVLHLAQKISTVRVGPFLLGFAMFVDLFIDNFIVRSGYSSRVKR